MQSQPQSRTIPDRSWLNQSVNPIQTRRERLALDRSETYKDTFTRNILDNNYIGSVRMNRK